MPKKQKNNTSNIATTSDPARTYRAMRFERIAKETMLASFTSQDKGIGTLAEKRMHAIIKKFICEDESCHEIIIGDMLADGDEGKKRKKITADVCFDGHIYEVQTGGFFPLKKKIEWYMTHTADHITVIAPIAAVKYLSWIDPASGVASERRRSPKRGRVQDIAKELYWLSDFIGKENFDISVMLLEIEEYRMQDGWGNGGKRGSNRYERIPLSLIDEIPLRSKEDYKTHFLPDALPSQFTAADYAKTTRIRGKATYSMLKILEALGLIEKSEKIGRAQGYVIPKGDETADKA